MGRRKFKKIEHYSTPFILNENERCRSVFMVKNGEKLEELINSDKVTELVNEHGYVHLKFEDFGGTDTSRDNKTLQSVLQLKNGFDECELAVNDTVSITGENSRSNLVSPEPGEPVDHEYQKTDEGLLRRKSSRTRKLITSDYKEYSIKKPRKKQPTEVIKQPVPQKRQFVVLFCYKKVANYVYERVLKRIPRDKLIQHIMRMKKLQLPDDLPSDDPLKYMEMFFDHLERNCRKINGLYLVLQKSLKIQDENKLPVIIDDLSTPLQKNVRVGGAPGFYGAYSYFSFPGSVFEMHTEDLNTNSLSINYCGDAKCWIVLNRRQSDRLRLLVRDTLTQKFRKLQPLCLLQHKKYFFHPLFLRNNKIEFQAVVQYAGSAILTGYEAFHQGVNTGVCLTKAINIITREYQENFDPSMVQCAHEGVDKITVDYSDMISFGKEIGANSPAFLKLIGSHVHNKSNSSKQYILPTEESSLSDQSSKSSNSADAMVQIDEKDAIIIDDQKNDGDSENCNGLGDKKHYSSTFNGSSDANVLSDSNDNGKTWQSDFRSPEHDNKKEESYFNQPPPNHESKSHNGSGNPGPSVPSSTTDDFYQQTKLEEEVVIKRVTTTTTFYRKNTGFAEKNPPSAEPSNQSSRRTYKPISYIGKREDFQDQIAAITDNQCPFCGSVFGFKKNLKYHLRMHFGEKPEIPCKYDGCSKVFQSSSHLNQHTRSVHEAIRHPCSVCGKDYSSRWKRNSHEATHKVQVQGQSTDQVSPLLSLSQGTLPKCE